MFFLVLLLPLSVSAQLVSWVPPHAQLVNAYVHNATVFSLMYQDLVYVVQEGLVFKGTRNEAEAAVKYLQHMCRYVAVDVVERSNLSSWEELWIGDVYCSEDGAMWLWLKWLPLRFSAFVGTVNFVNKSIVANTPVGNFSGLVPEGWYLDRRSKAVFKIPNSSLDLIEELTRLSATIQQLGKELQRVQEERNRTAEAAKGAEGKASQLLYLVKKLEASLQERETALRALEVNLRSTREEAEKLKARLEEVRRQLEETKSKLQMANESAFVEINKWRQKYESLLVQCGESRNGVLIWPVSLAAVAGVVAIMLKRRRSGD